MTINMPEKRKFLDKNIAVLVGIDLQPPILDHPPPPPFYHPDPTGGHLFDPKKTSDRILKSLFEVVLSMY